MVFYYSLEVEKYAVNFRNNSIKKVKFGSTGPQQLISRYVRNQVAQPSYHLTGRVTQRRGTIRPLEIRDKVPRSHWVSVIFLKISKVDSLISNTPPSSVLGKWNKDLLDEAFSSEKQHCSYDLFLWQFHGSPAPSLCYVSKDGDWPSGLWVNLVQPPRLNHQLPSLLVPFMGKWWVQAMGPRGGAIKAEPSHKLKSCAWRIWFLSWVPCCGFYLCWARQE